MTASQPDPGPFAAPVGDAALEASVRAGLASVEALLHETVKSDVDFVTEASRHLVEAGGKRFRPLLVLLASQFGDPAAPGVVPSAVVVELTHLATLYHDDVMDEAVRDRPGQGGRQLGPPAGRRREERRGDVI
jgi:heptaprenyl diphosphate synthase